MEELAINGFLKEPELPKQLEFKLINRTGILIIHSFASSMIEKGNQHFRLYIEKVFAELEKIKSRNLIVDLRDNTGGSDPYAEYFTSYFFDKALSILGQDRSDGSHCQTDQRFIYKGFLSRAGSKRQHLALAERQAYR